MDTPIEAPPWWREHAVQWTVPIVAGLGYVALRHVYVEFYGTFGLTPEDVGISYLDVMTRGGTSVLQLASWALLLLLVALATGALMRPRRSGEAARPPTSALVLLLAASLMPILFGLRYLYSEAERQSRAVIDGGHIVWLERSIGWRAEPAEVVWLAPDTRTLPACDRLRYLGTGDGIVNVYDSGRRRLYRIPADAVTLVVFRNGCPPPGTPL